MMKDDNWKDRMIECNKGDEIHIIHEPKFEKGDIVQHRASKQQAVIVQYKSSCNKYEVTTGFDEIFLCSEIVLDKVESEVDVVFQFKQDEKVINSQCPKCLETWRFSKKDLEDATNHVCGTCNEKIVCEITLDK